MIKYRIDISNALGRIGFNLYKAKTTKILSQNTLKKLKDNDTSITLESLNKVCMLLDMQPKDLIYYEETKEEAEEKKKYNF